MHAAHAPRCALTSLERQRALATAGDVGTRPCVASPAPVLGAGLGASYCPEHQ